MITLWNKEWWAVVLAVVTGVALWEVTSVALNTLTVFVLAALKTWLDPK